MQVRYFFISAESGFSANSEIFFLESNMADAASAGMNEGTLWLSLTVLTGPDIKTSIVKGQPNETIGDLLSRNEFLKGKQILKITGGATANVNINSASIELDIEMPITLLKGFNITHIIVTVRNKDKQAGKVENDALHLLMSLQRNYEHWPDTRYVL